MARNKNSTALFDVIHSAKKPPKASPSASIPTPKWWGKDKKLSKPPVAESTENAGRQKSWLSAAKRNPNVPLAPGAMPLVFENPSSTDPASKSFCTEQSLPQPAPDIESDSMDTSAEIEITSISPPEPKPRFIDRFKNRATTSLPPVEQVIVPPPIADEPEEWTESPELEIKPERRQPDRDRESAIKLDSSAHEIKFKLSYGGLAAILFFLIIALVFAFVVGSRSNMQAMFNDSPDPDVSPTTNPTGGLMVAMEPAKTPAPSPVHPEVLQVAPRMVKPVGSTTPVAASVPLPIKSTRDIGMIYVVVQSYAEQDIAQRACDYMNKAGIPCSLVQGPDGWAPRDWYSVVGLQPFAKHDPGLAEYERSVKALGARFTTRIIDQFQPQGYTWRESSDLSQP